MAQLQKQLFLMIVVCCGLQRPLEAKREGSCVPIEEAGSAPPAYEACRLEYYLHVEVGDAGLNQNFLPALNESYTGSFGHGEIFAFNITKGAEPDSTALGTVRGYTLQSAYRAGESNLIEIEFVVYDDGVYKGTIHIQGQILPSPNEVAITGGTGSFRGARGYGFIVHQFVDGNYRLFRHDLRFLH